jgi:hypothetical protein
MYLPKHIVIYAQKYINHLAISFLNQEGTSEQSRDFFINNEINFRFLLVFVKNLVLSESKNTLSVDELIARVEAAQKIAGSKIQIFAELLELTILMDKIHSDALRFIDLMISRSKEKLPNTKVDNRTKQKNEMLHTSLFDLDFDRFVATQKVKDKNTKHKKSFDIINVNLKFTSISDVQNRVKEFLKKLTEVYDFMLEHYDHTEYLQEEDNSEYDDLYNIKVELYNIREDLNILSNLNQNPKNHLNSYAHIAYEILKDNNASKQETLEKLEEITKLLMINKNILPEDTFNTSKRTSSEKINKDSDFEHLLNFCKRNNINT